MRRSLVVVMLLLTSAFSYADDKYFTLEEIPLLRPMKLLVSQLNPNVHLLFAIEAGGGNHYLLVNDGGKIYVPKMKQNSRIYYDGGTADLNFETGDRVVLPSGTINYLNTTLGATIVHPNQAPTPLTEIEISNEKLQEVGFARFIAPPKEVQSAPDAPEEWESYRPLPNLNTKVLISIRFDGLALYKAEKNIEEGTKSLDASKVRYLERGDAFFGNNSLVLIADPDMVDAVRALVPEDVDFSIGIFDAKKLSTKHQKISRKQLLKDLASLNDKTVPLQTRAAQLSAIRQNSEFLNTLSEAEKIELIRGVFFTLVDLDQIHSRLHYLAMYETTVQDFKSGLSGWDYSVHTIHNRNKTEETHAMVPLMLDPIRQVARQAYEIFDLANHPLGRGIVVETANVLQGAGLSLLQGQVAGMNHSYFREWLDQQRVQMTLVDRLPEVADYKSLKALEVSINSTGGGVYQNIKVSGDMNGIRSEAQQPLYYRLRDDTQALPTLLFGLPGDKKVLKREFIQYVIEADKKAEKLVKWAQAASKRRDGGHAQERFSVRGDDSLLKLIVGLTYLPQGWHFLPQFSKFEYTLTVIEILQQLLEIAPTSLVNMGTYVSVLDASVGMIQNVKRDYGFDNLEQSRLVAAAVQLQDSVNTKMLNGLSWMSTNDESAKACEIILSADPWKASR